jgi:hypothetical protein
MNCNALECAFAMLVLASASSVNPRRAESHAARTALRPEGTLLMVGINASSILLDNFDLPWGTFLYAISTFHCMSVSPAPGWEP